MLRQIKKLGKARQNHVKEKNKILKQNAKQNYDEDIMKLCKTKPQIREKTLRFYQIHHIPMKNFLYFDNYATKQTKINGSNRYREQSYVSR